MTHTYKGHIYIRASSFDTTKYYNTLMKEFHLAFTEFLKFLARNQEGLTCDFFLKQKDHRQLTLVFNKIVLINRLYILQWTKVQNKSFSFAAAKADHY